MVPEASDIVIRRTIFSLCGWVVEHLPVCEWASFGLCDRQAGSQCGHEGMIWRGEGHPPPAYDVLNGGFSEAEWSGSWELVRGSSGAERVGWCQIFRNRCSAGKAWGCAGGPWRLWPENDAQHINQTEIDAMLKDINLAPFLPNSLKVYEMLLLRLVRPSLKFGFLYNVSWRD